MYSYPSTIRSLLLSMITLGHLSCTKQSRVEMFPGATCKIEIHKSSMCQPNQALSTKNIPNPLPDIPLSIELTNPYSLFRHESELQRDIKGGYIEGSIILPPLGPDKDIPFSLELIGIGEDEFHSNVLHLVNIRQKGQRGEFLKYDWRLNFVKKNNRTVYYIHPVTGKEIYVMTVDPVTGKENTICLGPNGIKINVITPKLSKSPNESFLSISEVLACRYKQQAAIIEAQLKAKDAGISKNSIRLKLICEEKTANSRVIKNSRNKNTAPINIKEVHPFRCCNKGMRTNVFFHHMVHSNLKFKLLLASNPNDIFGSLCSNRTMNHKVSTYEDLDKSHIRDTIASKVRIPYQEPRHIISMAKENQKTYLIAYRTDNEELPEATHPMDCSNNLDCSNPVEIQYFECEGDACGACKYLVEPASYDLPNTAKPGVKRRNPIKINSPTAPKQVAMTDATTLNRPAADRSNTSLLTLNTDKVINLMIPKEEIIDTTIKEEPIDDTLPSE